MRYAILFSGGMDSTAGLSEVLKTDPSGVYDIIHVQFRLRHKCFWISQLNSVVNILEQLKKDYPKAIFNLHTADISFPLPDRNSKLSFYDVNFHHMYAGIIINNNLDAYEFILDCITRPTKELKIEGWIEGDQLMDFYSPGASNKINRMFLNIKRIDIYKKIPNNIVNLTWSCFAPNIINNKIHPCGKCYKCKNNDELGISNNITDISMLSKAKSSFMEYSEEIEKSLLRFK